MNEEEHILAWLALPTGRIRRNGEPQTKRNLINLSEIEVYADMPERTLTKWLNGHQELAPVHIHNLMDALSMHGYTPLMNDHNYL